MKYITILSLLSKLVFTILIFVCIRKDVDYIYQPLLNAAGFGVSAFFAFYIILNKLKVHFLIPSLNSISFSTAQLIVTVEAEATTINISGTGTLTAGQSTTLTATVENGSGDTLWGCEETSWRTTGTQVTFTANEPGTYHIHAVNNGADSVFVLTVSAAATPEPTAVPTPMPESTSADSTPQ